MTLKTYQNSYIVWVDGNGHIFYDMLEAAKYAEELQEKGCTGILIELLREHYTK